MRKFNKKDFNRVREKIYQEFLDVIDAYSNEIHEKDRVFRIVIDEYGKDGFMINFDIRTENLNIEQISLKLYPFNHQNHRLVTGFLNQDEIIVSFLKIGRKRYFKCNICDYLTIEFLGFSEADLVKLYE